ncbi:hypothetical protein [Pseudomonas sp. PICF6]|uniref:hypothetical protein n=1 Tax=Pseudomonas sp. PICF6 TaxID=2664172 RepID=UPI00136A3165|nr:hypothetical protein [Pseudomonas sp. PICF6]MXR29259.1 hypothetical protein [Pseudomonas sp. PICF6]
MSPAANGPETPKPPRRSRSLSTQQYLYFTETNTDRILDNLDGLRDSVFPRPPHLVDDESERDQQEFPSVCLIGLGRCGSNIALDVAELVYNARKFYLNEFNAEDKGYSDKGYSPAQWIRNNLRLGTSKVSKPVFLVEPLVMLGDLDKDIAGRIRFSRKGEKSGFLRDYSKMKIMDLSEVHAGGAGNAPILGQYLAKIILNKDTQRFSSPDWKMIHSYLIDSCGIKANQSRLYFSIFSAGGGTGSGMASEFGLAQQYSYMNKTFDTKPMDEHDSKSGHSFVFEPIFTSGICVLPNISDHRSEMSEALHINAGRLLCKYLSEEWDFSYNFANEDSSEASVMGRIRPWNAMMLISNDIMRYAEESDDGNIQNIDVNAMEKHANQYISQQIFNILFPNTTLKRYALVIGASANLSLTTLIAKSPCLSDDFLTLIVAFIKRCFARTPYRFDDTLDNSILDFIINEDFDEERIDDLLNEFENPAKILDTNWYAIKPMYEKKYRELISDKDKFVSINDIRLSRDCVKKAIKYLREIYRHRIGKTKVISLNNHTGKTY